MLYLFEVLTKSGNRYTVSCGGFSVRDLSYDFDLSEAVQEYKVSCGTNTCLTPGQFNITSAKWVEKFDWSKQ